MKRWFWSLLLTALALATPVLFAGQSPKTAAGAASSAIPTITFTCDWEATTPQKYSITVKPDGSAHYQSSSPTRPDKDSTSNDEDYQLDFTLSAANRDKIFKLAEQAEYFNGDFEFHKHAIANTGKKTLSYADATRYFQTVFNYSENQAIQELSQIFRGISATLQHGRKLQFLRRFDRLGMEEELKAAEANAESHSLAELQLIAPLLESIANDSGILNIARQRAKRLLAQSGVQ
ncbi:MAG: hypothetical protein LAO20_06710 [Acidobacteriia bacterium]|nr:hypothetical protein [Terriglobia bacterium]